MSRLPTPGGDSGTWADILNDFLSQAHASDGTLKPGSIVESQLSSAVVTKLNATGSGTVSDASSSTKGILKLTGDLAGTADSPTVPGLAAKEPTIMPGTTSQYYRGDKTFQPLDKAVVGLGNVDDTSDTSKPISTAQQAALDTKAPLNSPTFTGTVTVPTPTNVTDASTKGYVDTQVSYGATPDATTSTKGKVQLAGDLAGTADSPSVVKINGVTLSGLGTGILKNTTGTGAPSIATIGDFPVLNQSTTGNAATATKATALQTPRNINGVAFDGTADITVADSTKVPTTTQVNGHALSSNVTITASDVGAPSGSGTSTGTNTGDQVIPTSLPPTGTAGGDLKGSYPNPTLNSATLAANNFTLQDATDPTKQALFDLSGIGTATTRTIPLPNGTTQLVNLGSTQTLTNKTLTAPIINQAVPTNTTSIITTTTTLTTGNRGGVYYADATSASFTINMPATTTVGYPFRIVRLDNTANTVTITAVTTPVFDAGPGTTSTSILLNSGGMSVDLQSTATSGTWKTTSFSKKVTSTNNALVKFNGTNGDLLNSAVTLDSAGTFTSNGTSLGFGVSLGSGSSAAVIQRNGTGQTLLEIASTGLTNTSGVQSGLLVDPVINQTGTAAYNGIYVNLTEASTGSGIKNLVNLAIAGSTKFAVNNAGNVTSGTVNGLDLASYAMGTVVHGATASTPRPANYAVVTWIGTVAPTNAIANDIWIDKS